MQRVPSQFPLLVLWVVYFALVLMRHLATGRVVAAPMTFKGTERSPSKSSRGPYNRSNVESGSASVAFGLVDGRRRFAVQDGATPTAHASLLNRHSVVESSRRMGWRL
ncbi:hypothetical protein BJV77DRAFT_326720 [Russula vinacea]|nr:hypothetical protein BJV77DRAFT_326720 [Russula vinacea]